MSESPSQQGSWAPPSGWATPASGEPSAWPAGEPPAPPIPAVAAGQGMGAERVWPGGTPLGGIGLPPVVPAAPRRGLALNRHSAGALLLVLGGAMVLGGTFAPWLVADVRGLGIWVGSGWHNIVGRVGDGPLFAAGACVLVLVGVAATVGVAARWLRIVAGGVAVAVAAGAVYELVDLATPPDSIAVSVRPGLPVMLVGVCLALVGLAMSAGAGVGSSPRS